jgi:hypothetical protein
MSGMDDVFGVMPNRPNHPDFWKLSQVILRMDGAMEAATSEDEKEAVFASFVGGHVDLPSLAYVATHRAMRALGTKTQMEVAANFKEVARLASLYMDGFTTACEYLAAK